MARMFPNAYVQENFGMSEGMLFFVRRTDPEDVRMETIGTSACPDDEVRHATGALLHLTLIVRCLVDLLLI